MIGFVSCSINNTWSAICITLLSLFLAYVVIVTFIGYYRAWIANKMGDSTAVEAGFLTLNPIRHIDIKGLLCLFVFRFGWGQSQPHNPTKIIGNLPDSQVGQEVQAPRFLWLKLCVAYVSSVVLHIGLAIFDMFVLLCILGKNIAGLADTMIFHGSVSYTQLASMYPNSSAATIFIALVLMAAIYIHAFSSVFNLLFRGSNIFMMYASQRFPRFVMYHNFLKVFLAVLVIIFFLTPGIRLLLIKMISSVAMHMAHLFNIV